MYAYMAHMAIIQKKTTVRFKGHRSQKNRLKLNFDISCDVFDKSLRQAERIYNNNIVLNIEQMSHNNPKQFWKKIKDMGPKKSDLPTKIEKNGNVITYGSSEQPKFFYFTNLNIRVS